MALILMRYGSNLFGKNPRIKEFLLTINIEEDLTAQSSRDAKTNAAKQKNIAQQESHSKEISMSN